MAAERPLPGLRALLLSARAPSGLLPTLRVLEGRSAERVGAALARCTGLSYRALALFRIALALCTVVDHCTLIVDAEPLLSDRGLWSRQEFLRSGSGADGSVFLLSGGVLGLRCLLLAGVVLSVLVAAGAPGLGLCWAALGYIKWSMWLRFGATMWFTGAHHLWMHMLLWGAFLPLGEVWSLQNPRGTPRPLAHDGHKKHDDLPAGGEGGEGQEGEPAGGPKEEERVGPKRSAPPQRCESMAALALVINVVLMYVTTGVRKATSASDWQDGTYIQYILWNHQYAREPIAGWVRQLPALW